MMVLNVIIPGAGLLNHLVNPTVTNAYSKSQELEADANAAKICTSCLNIPTAKLVAIMKDFQQFNDSGGGLWSSHPNWDDRIDNIQGSH